MNQVASKAQASIQYATLIENPSTLNALLVLLTRDYSDGSISQDKFIEIMKHTCSTLTSVAYNNFIAEKILTEYNIIKIVKELLDGYFLTGNGLQINEIVEQKNIQELMKRVNLMQEMIWFANNLIAQDGYNHEKIKFVEVAIKEGLHDTYFNIIEAYS
jgi:hypothetical protein